MLLADDFLAKVGIDELLRGDMGGLEMATLGALGFGGRFTLVERYFFLVVLGYLADGL